MLALVVLFLFRSTALSLRRARQQALIFESFKVLSGELLFSKRLLLYCTVYVTLITHLDRCVAGLLAGALTIFDGVLATLLGHPSGDCLLLCHVLVA